jgi:hypothetical protein
MNANIIQMNRLEKTGVCVRKFVTKNSGLQVSTGCNIHTKSTANHIHSLPRKVSPHFLYIPVMDTSQ